MHTGAVRRHNGQICDATRFLDVNPWVAAAIRSEEMKEPTALWRGAPDEAAAVAERRGAIKRLSRSRPDDVSALLIRRLQYCSREHRCFSAACPECARLFQRAFVRAVRRFFRDKHCKPDIGLVAISLVCRHCLVREKHLHSFDARNFIRRIKKALKAAGLEVCIGAVDFSFNEDANGSYEPHWCPHAYIVTPTTDGTRLLQALKKHFPPDGPALLKPIRIRPFENSPRRISYIYKATFGRRISYVDREGRRNTSRDRLLACQRVELAKYLNQTGFASRLIFVGAKGIVNKGRIEIIKLGQT